MKKGQMERKEILLTPVDSFIKEQSRKYKDAARAKGFSKAKHEAVLWTALRAGTEREHAKVLGLSYDVLRQCPGGRRIRA